MLDILTANLYILHILCSDLIEILARSVVFLQVYRTQRIQDTQPERTWARIQTQVCLIPRAGLYPSLPLLDIWEDQNKLQYKKGMPSIPSQIEPFIGSSAEWKLKCGLQHQWQSDPQGFVLPFSWYRIVSQPETVFLECPWIQVEQYLTSDQVIGMEEMHNTSTPGPTF